MVLQGRLFSYADTHRHRLGANYQQIPINRPFNSKVCCYGRAVGAGPHARDPTG